MRFTWTIAWTGIAVPALMPLPSVGAQQTRIAQQPTKPVSSDWPLYRHDLAGTGYSPLMQITVQNANRLTMAWTYHFPADAESAAGAHCLHSRTTADRAQSIAGAIVTAGGVLFVGSTDDNRFRAIDAKTGTQLWVTKLDRRANADPITYQGRDGKQYVAIVATDGVVTFSLP
jgi:glucose dehydrogenase